MKEGHHQIYFLKCDIHKYFPSIDHKCLLGLLKTVDFSKDEMWMIEKLVKEQPDYACIGLPLGNQSSQWFALFYLNVVDHYIKEVLQVKYYVRYMDDMILIHRDKQFLIKCKKEIEHLCQHVLHLALNDKTQIGILKNGIDFLGYRHILGPSGKIIVKLRSSSKQRMKQHLKTMHKLYQKGIVDDAYVKIRKLSFYNHIKNTKESSQWKKELLMKE